MDTAAQHPLPPDVLDEPETIDFHPAGVNINVQSDPPTTPTVSPDDVPAEN